MECIDCKFFKMVDDLRGVIDEDYWGRCRRYPPVMIPDSEDMEIPFEWEYPFVGVGYWCGEFTGKEIT